MATVMELMRELKHLGELKRTGQITPELEARMAQLKGVLDNQMVKGNSSPPRPMPAGAAAPSQSGVGLPRVPTNPNVIVPPAPAAPQAAPQAAVRPAATAQPPASWGAPAAQPAAAPRPAAAPPPQAAAAPPVAQSRLAATPKLKAGSSLEYVKPESREKLGNKLLEVEQKADAAIQAQRKRVQPKTQDEAVGQLQEISSRNAYTPPDVSSFAGEYFGYGDGFAPVEEPVDLPLIDPREEDLKALKAALAATGGDVSALATPGGVFLDDFLELYTSGLLSTEPIFADDADSDDPNLVIPGRRKVTVHMLSGEVKRGIIARLGRGEPGFTLLPQGPGKPESISMGQIKAIFVNLNPGAAPAAGTGQAITVTFKDKRSVQGQSPDFGQGQTFTLIPPAGRQGVEKMIINQAACLEVR